MTGRDWLVWGPLDWQSRGQGFKSPQLHLKALVTGLFSRLWVSRIWDHVHYRSTIDSLELTDIGYIWVLSIAETRLLGR